MRPNAGKVSPEYEELLYFDALKKSVRTITRSMIYSIEQKKVNKRDVIY